MNIIEIINLEKHYSEAELLIKAVNKVSFSVKKGEFIVIVGPSGSGKTTLLNLIGGLDSPTSGEIFVDGLAIHKMKQDQLTDFRLFNIGFVFQAYNLIPVLTAKENIELIMKLQGISQKECNKRTAALLEVIGLSERADSKPSKLSGGQQQRVAVARSIASGPKFILADEPTANLDSHSAEALLDTMQKLNQNEGTTFIFSTHDPRIMKRAKRIIKLEDGKIIDDITYN
ncbi:MAG: ABC transporter ATP-binding protein [Bacteroidales bacterium]|nr:ABC transporter ATP-binding protein [Bacteroidales bacterium]MDP2236283.1 ABC transporter ATP-binding protein [Bacteroidales bacterium]